MDTDLASRRDHPDSHWQYLDYQEFKALNIEKKIFIGETQLSSAGSSEAFWPLGADYPKI